MKIAKWTLPEDIHVKNLNQRTTKETQMVKINPDLDSKTTQHVEGPIRIWRGYHIPPHIAPTQDWIGYNYPINPSI